MNIISNDHRVVGMNCYDLGARHPIQLVFNKEFINKFGTRYRVVCRKEWNYIKVYPDIDGKEINGWYKNRGGDQNLPYIGLPTDNLPEYIGRHCFSRVWCGYEFNGVENYTKVILPDAAELKPPGGRDFVNPDLPNTRGARKRKVKQPNRWYGNSVVAPPLPVIEEQVEDVSQTDPNIFHIPHRATVYETELEELIGTVRRTNELLTLFKGKYIIELKDDLIDIEFMGKIT